MSERPRIGYAGLTHLGLVSAIAAAAKGFEVVGYDADGTRVAAIARGELPVVEPDLDGLLASARPALTFTSDVQGLAACDVVYVAVDVPTDDDGRSDVGPVTALLTAVAEVVTSGAIVVLSQVQPGFTRALRERVERGGARLAYQVETLIFGRAVERALHPERYMVGLGEATDPLPPPLAAFLAAFDCPVLPMRYESAELCKISINMFLVASVSTTNMLAEVCEAVGAEWRDIAPALRLDKRIGQHAYLTPGLGIGGGNLTRDLASVQALAGHHGTDAGLITAWQTHSRYRRDWALRVLHGEGVGDSGAVLAVWGLAYKENTHFTRNSPALALIGALPAVAVRAYDPAVAAAETPATAERAGTALEAVRGADMLAIMTPWPEFAAADWQAVAALMRGRVLVDPFGVADPTAAARAGFRHHRLGTAAPAAPVPAPA
jgi:UDPglucose 6-dehydrogenase